ncbi:universal stress protein [Oceanimonas sp. CHS3-5]|uniref:universal stress protein n=1 Tax=Oceanimonas sp. CHS3-5 TaxID=3068186 RepID=UPI00273D04BB|nr:universal stress protein [Oceanimonas sp. CHS3-5]MDP5293618.1 universal stress protein [Oceanimonas sp. CHS3-5]
MSRINHILHATDFSDGAAEAAALARELAEAHGARLHLLHVITELDDRHRRGIPASVMEAFVKEVKTQAMTDLHAFTARYFNGFEGELTTEIRLGRGAEEILAGANALKADLIVLGTHGRRGMEKWLLGSTAERVLRQSAIPVLTVPERG